MKPGKAGEEGLFFDTLEHGILTEIEKPVEIDLIIKLKLLYEGKIVPPQSHGDITDCAVC